MNKYRMKPLQNLEKYEQQVKIGVRQRIAARETKKRKSYVPQFIGVVATLTLAALLFFIINSAEKSPLDTSSEPNDPLVREVEVSLTDVQIGTLAARESYFIATELKWNAAEDERIMSIEFLDKDGNFIDYKQHHVAFRIYNTGQLLSPGVYKKSKIDFEKLEDFSPANFTPNSDNLFLIEVLVNTSFVPQDDFYVQLTFISERTGHVQLISWNSLATLAVVPVDFNEILNRLNLSPEELSAYETFKESMDQNALSKLTPLSVARLYLLAEIEGNEELQYAFYITDPEYVAWSFEQQQTLSPFDTQSLEKTIQLFEALSTGTFVETEENRGYISFFAAGSPTPSGFQMIRNTEGIWQVGFMPLQ